MRWMTACVWLAMVTVCGAAATSEQLMSLTDKCDSSLVTIRYVMKVAMQEDSQEINAEAPGVIIRSDGVVLATNSLMGGLMKRYGGSSKPTDIKVLVGRDEEEFQADIVAVDNDLDLAWLVIKNPAKKVFDAIDFKADAVPTIGEAVYGVRRMSKFFDRASIVEFGVVAAIVKRPRDLYVTSGDLSQSLGTVTMNAVGRIVGITVMQIPGEEDAEQAVSLGTRRDDMTTKVLPAAKVVRETERAMKLAAEKAKSQPTSQPTSGPALLMATSQPAEEAK